jgi:purine-binding chemotaxis protein CheW
MSTSAARYLIFQLAGGLCALELGQVAEVCEPPVVWPVPAAPPCYRGAMSFHGAITAVMDLAFFMGLPEERKAEKLIVLHPDIASLAFLVRRTLRIVPADRVQLRQVADEPFVIGLLALPEGETRVLDAEKITEQATAAINPRDSFQSG